MKIQHKSAELYPSYTCYLKNIRISDATQLVHIIRIRLY